MDMYTTIRGIQMEEDEIVKAVREIISVDVGDGINFEYESIEPIREDDAYNNFRIHLRAEYGKISLWLPLTRQLSAKLTEGERTTHPSRLCRATSPDKWRLLLQLVEIISTSCNSCITTSIFLYLI